MNDQSLLANLDENRTHSALGSPLARLAAAATLALTWPVLLATAVVLRLTRAGPVLARRDVVRLPTPADPARWRSVRLWSFQSRSGDGLSPPGRGLSDLVLRVLPGLIHVVRGDLNLVGVTPRTEAELRALPHDWQVLVLRAAAGLITEAILFPEDALSADECDAADACFATMPGLPHQLALLLAYLKQLAGAPAKRTAGQGVIPCPTPRGG